MYGCRKHLASNQAEIENGESPEARQKIILLIFILILASLHVSQLLFAQLGLCHFPRLGLVALLQPLLKRLSFLPACSTAHVSARAYVNHMIIDVMWPLLVLEYLRKKAALQTP